MDFAPMRQRNFLLLWTAGLISLTGSWVLHVALPIYVLLLTGSPAAVSAVIAAGLLGNVLVGSFAGAYVDRWDRKRVVVVVNALQALTLLPLLLVDRPALVWVVVAVAFAESALTRFFQPAENALLPRLVEPELLVAANSWNSLNNNTGRLLGPAVGGVAVASMGLDGAALVSATTFAVAALLCSLIIGQHRADRTEEPHRHLLRELGEGLRAVQRNRILRAIFALFAITSVGEGLMSTLFAVYVTRALGAGPREMGWMFSAQAVGGILGSLAGTRFTARARPVPLIMVCFVIFGLVDLAIFTYPLWDTTLWPVVALFVLVGVPVGIHVPALMTLMQVHNPDRLRGRVFAALGVCGALFGILGAAVAGWLGGTVSVIGLLSAHALGCIAAGLLFRLMAGLGPATLAEPLTPAAAPA